MFQEKVENQTEELTKAKDRQEMYRVKYHHLENENINLIYQMVSNQKQLMEGKNNILTLFNQITQQKKLNFETMELLQMANQKIKKMELSLAKMREDECISLFSMQLVDDEQLSFKQHVIDCLEKKLTEYRLQSAEDDNTITELKDQITSHEKDIEMLKEKKPNAVANWQQELMETKLRIENTKKEFLRIKEQIDNIKTNSFPQILEEEEPESLKISLPLYRKNELKTSIQQSNDKIFSYSKEIEMLKEKIKHYEEQQQNITEKLILNEKVRSNLKEIALSLDFEHKEKLRQIGKLREKYTELNNKFDDEILKLEISNREKNITITELNSRLERLSVTIKETEQISENNKSEENAISELNETIDCLEEKIAQARSKHEVPHSE